MRNFAYIILFILSMLMGASIYGVFFTDIPEIFGIIFFLNLFFFVFLVVQLD